MSAGNSSGMFGAMLTRLSVLRPPRRRPPLRTAIVALVATILSIAGSSPARGAGSSPPSKLVRSSPPSLFSLVLQDLAGAQVHPLTNDGRKATVFFFIMHECPVANGYAPEISRILAEYAPRGVRGHVIYVESDLTAIKAREHARDYGYKSGGLLDPKHQLVHQTGATISPEAAVVSPSGEVLYLGRIDDRVADLGKRRVQPTTRDLRLALDAIVAGRKIPAQRTKAVGCYIPDAGQAHSDSKSNP